jgi:hypothetical protein
MCPPTPKELAWLVQCTITLIVHSTHYADMGVPEPAGDDGGAVPHAAADQGVREHVGRGGDGLVPGRAPFTASYKGLAASGCH